MQFYLMNKNNPVAVIDCTGDMIRWDEILDKIYMQNLNTLTGNLNNWLMFRTRTAYRKNIWLLQRCAGIYDKESLLRISKGLRTDDTLWFKGKDEDTSWEEVTPFKGPLNETISKLALSGEYDTGDLDTPSAEHLMGGTVEKCCKIIDGELCIVKGFGPKYNSFTGSGAESEGIYTQLCEYLEIYKKGYVQYRLVGDRSGDNIHEYSVCRAFTNDNIGYIAYADSRFRSFNLAETLDLVKETNYEKQFKDMLILDAITFNVDRHKMNYGFMVDNDTFDILGMAPNFDYDSCAFANINMLKEKDSIKNEIDWMRSDVTFGKFADLAKTVMYPDMLEKLEAKAGGFKLDVSRLGAINDFDTFRSEKIERILNLQMGRIVKLLTE